MEAQISFAGSGGMYHYYLGIAKVIQDNFNLDKVLFGAVSGGCFPALLLALGVNIDIVHYDLNHKMLEEAANYRFGSLFRWNEIVRRHMFEFLDEDSYIKVKDRLYISMTKIRPWENEIISDWDSTEDLIHCIQCSCFIPMFFEPKLWYWHRNARYIDGAFTNRNVVIDPNLPIVYMTTDMWRTVYFNWMWCYSDPMWAEQLYKWGKEDATNHLEEFARYLPPKGEN